MTNTAITSATATVALPSLARPVHAHALAPAPGQSREMPNTGAVGTASARPPDHPVETRAQADPDQIRQALDEVREAISPVAQNLLFSIDDDTGHTVVKIVDSSTDEVIKQIPSEEFLAIAKALDRLQGLLIKQKA